MPLEKIDSLLKQLGSVYETDEVIARTYGEAEHDWHAVERFVGWICGHSQNALKAAKNRDETEVTLELGRALLMMRRAVAALGRSHEAAELEKIAKTLQTADVAERKSAVKA